MRTFSERLGKGWTGKKHVNDFDTWYVRGYSWAAESASLKDLAALREYLLTSRGGKLTDQHYNPSPQLAFADKSILTFFLRKSNRWGNPLDLSPLDAIGFIEGALEWRLQRNKLLRSRLRKKKRLLALPVPRQNSSQQFGQAINLQDARSRRAMCRRGRDNNRRTCRRQCKQWAHRRASSAIPPTSLICIR